MYIPRYNEEKDRDKIVAFIRENGFGLLVNVQDGVPVATHIPMELETDGEQKPVLRGHIAKANLQWTCFEGRPRVLAVFTAAHSYISSSWYHDEKIPTWNYIAVHVYGILRVLPEEELRASLESLMNRYEQSSVHPVSMHDIPEEELRKNLKAIVGFEIAVEEMLARYKLSQNRDDTDYFNVISGLRKKGGYNAEQIAHEMEKRRHS